MQPKLSLQLSRLITLEQQATTFFTAQIKKDASIYGKE
jgi:hypothetical protein